MGRDGSGARDRAAAGMTMIRRALIALLPLILWCGVAWGQSCDTPAPGISPGSAEGVGGAPASFGGTWQGQWPIAVKGHIEPICAKLYIQVASDQIATVEQCTGSNSETRRKAECKRYSAQISDNVMTFTDPQGTVYTFTMADVGGMKGEATSAQHRSVTLFTRIN